MLKPNELVYRFLQRLPIRMLSLRSIVIVAALAVVALVLTLGVWVWVGVTNDQYSQLDRRLDSVSSLGDFSTLLSGPPAPGTPSPDGNLVRTVRVGTMAMSSKPYAFRPDLKMPISTSDAMEPSAHRRLRAVSSNNLVDPTMARSGGFTPSTELQ